MVNEANPEMLRIAREVRMLTQKQLAAKSGVSQPDLSRYEGGIKPIPDDNLQKLAAALEFPVSFFHQAGRSTPRLYCPKNLRQMR